MLSLANLRDDGIMNQLESEKKINLFVEGCESLGFGHVELWVLLVEYPGIDV